MFKHLNVTELVYTGELSTPDFVKIGQVAGNELKDRVDNLYNGHTFVVLCFRGFQTYNNARSVGFAVKEYLRDKGLTVAFTAMECDKGFSTRIKATKQNPHVNETATHRAFNQVNSRPITFESQYGSGSIWDLSSNGDTQPITREDAPKNLDVFPGTWHEVASDSVVEFYSSLGVSL